MKNLLVLCGGTSVEHDVSVITGVLTYNAIDKKEYNPIMAYVSKAGEWYVGEGLDNVKNYSSIDLKKLNKITFVLGDNKIYYLKAKTKLIKGEAIACCINCLHGGRGEDGSIAGFMKLCNIPLASSGVFSSAVSMDKEYTKIALNGLGIKNLECFAINKDNYYSKKEEVCTYLERVYGLPLIVKPATLGSSIGISVAHNQEQLTKAFDLAFKYDVKVIVEKALVGFKEINCACYKDGKNLVVSECEEPLRKSDILTFDQKYKESKIGEAKRKFPADIDKDLSDKIKETTKRIYRKLGFSGVIRVDYLLKDKEVFVNEINSVPGSMAYYLFGDTIKSLYNVIKVSVTLAIENCNSQNACVKSFSSNVLNLDGFKGKK